MSGRTYGLLLVTIATIIWSTAGLFVRMLDLDVWTMLGWRSFFGGATLTLVAVFQNRTAKTPAAKNPSGLYLAGALLAGISMFGYIAALKLTSVANVLAIYATVPFFAAGIAYAWLGERAERRVVTASAIAFFGVLIVAGFAVRPQDLGGIGLALLMTVCLAALMVLVRRYPGVQIAPINAIGSGLCVLLCLPLMSHAIPSVAELAILAVFGATTSGFAYLLFITGGRYVPAGEAGLIALLDIVLGPVWVWLAFGENPGLAAVIGGGLILFSLIWYLWSGLRSARAAGAIRAADPA